MNKNLILFLIAIGLGVFTYFFQEIPDRKEYKEKQLRGALLDPVALGELKGIILPEVEIAKQGEQYLLLKTGELVDSRKIDWFMNILSKIKMRRVLPKSEWKEKERELFFPNDSEKMIFAFQNGKVSFLLGSKLEFDRSFYMEVEDGEKVSRVIAFDDGNLDAVYNEGDGHRSDHYYRRFQSLFYLKADFFRDYRIFRHWMNKKWSLLEVTIDNKRNRKFSLNFPEGRTEPNPPFFLSSNLELMGEIEKKLVAIEGKEFVEKRDADFEKEPMATMVVNSTVGEVTLRLLKSKRDKQSYFLESTLDKNIYKIEKKHTPIFFKNVQEFWNLKALRERPESMSFVFDLQKRKPVYKIDFETRDGRFHALWGEKEANHVNFKDLLNFLQKEASYWVYDVDLLESFIPQFAINWGLGPFFLGIRSGEIVLYHKEKHHALIYKLKGSPPIKMVKEDYLGEF
ncbi:MAG: hypothetical protein NXH75_02695 [Halobacteriovoraceae bacterium]|nr:hypothetical protein [Halobacteriovoraceae bacterium]